MANSSKLFVGQKTIAIGSPFGFDHTLTTGVISARQRSIMGVGSVTIHDMIQTDASINPGNSGGPLLNSSGELIGMNTVIVSKSGSSSGVGFAVPANTIKRIVNQIIKYGRVRRPGFGFVAVPEDISRRLGVKSGLLVGSVKEGSEAQKAGLRSTLVNRRGQVNLGDIIVGVEDNKVRNFDELYNSLDKKEIGDVVSVRVYRNGKVVSLRIKLMDVGG